MLPIWLFAALPLPERTSERKIEKWCLLVRKENLKLKQVEWQYLSLPFKPGLWIPSRLSNGWFCCKPLKLLGVTSISLAETLRIILGEESLWVWLNAVSSVFMMLFKSDCIRIASFWSAFCDACFSVFKNLWDYFCETKLKQTMAKITNL